MTKAIEMGYRSHSTSTCGIHIHASRSAFGKTYEQQEEVIARIVHFVELHWNELLKFTRRTEENITRWAARYGISTRAYDTYKNAKDKHMGRYVAVNLENCNTIEFRLFRGTLLYSTFAATLQLVDEICNMAIRLTDKEERINYELYRKWKIQQGYQYNPDVPIVTHMEKLLGKKVYVENDANAAAWGEYLAGSGKGTDSMIMITLGTGVGSGIIDSGHLLTGAYGKGAEIGHMVIRLNGKKGVVYDAEILIQLHKSGFVKNQIDKFGFFTFLCEK